MGRFIYQNAQNIILRNLQNECWSLPKIKLYPEIMTLPKKHFFEKNHCLKIILKKKLKITCFDQFLSLKKKGLVEFTFR